MSEELDRRIAVEVMGERVLPKLDDRELDEDLWPTYSPGGNWWCTLKTDWTPRSFSSDLDLAMKAVDKHFEDRRHTDAGELARKAPRVLFEYYFVYPKQSMRYSAHWEGKSGQGWTLPEAICNLLLALVEEKR